MLLQMKSSEKISHNLHWISSKTWLLSPSPSELLALQVYWPIWARFTFVITKLWFDIKSPSLLKKVKSRPYLFGWKWKFKIGNFVLQFFVCWENLHFVSNLLYTPKDLLWCCIQNKHQLLHEFPSWKSVDSFQTLNLQREHLKLLFQNTQRRWEENSFLLD